MKKICALLVLMAVCPVVAQAQQGFVAASTLPDLSGLAPAGDGRFLAVHDAKNPDELERPRVSVLFTPQDLDGVRYKALTVDWGGFDDENYGGTLRPMPPID